MNSFRFRHLCTTTHYDPESGYGTSEAIPVFIKAYYVARGIEIIKIHSSLYPSARKEFSSKMVTVYINESLNQYISVFSYGSVVLFNIPEEDHMHHLRQIRKMSKIPIAEVLQHEEDYKLMVHKELETPAVIHAEHLNIRELDANNVTIVSIILAQTVALDYFAANVDQMIDKFGQLNLSIQETGSFTAIKEKDLYKLVASNNSIFTNVLSKLGFFEGTDVAWENAEYSIAWDGETSRTCFTTHLTNQCHPHHLHHAELREEFELESRYKDLSLKLNIINDDARFFLAVLHHHKSTKLEWLIIALISGEMFIGIAGLAMQIMGAPPH